MRIAIAGSTGLIGQALVDSLRADSYEVCRLVRHVPSAPDEYRWDPESGAVDPAALEGSDALVNLAGAGIAGHRWTEAYKRRIRDSRIHGTRTLVRALADCTRPPGVFLCGSAIGWYGDTGEQPVTETAPAGSGFLPELCRDWEAEAARAEASGARVVCARTGIVLAAQGGALQPMLPLFRLGLGGRLGPGSQYWSCVSLQDEVAALRFLLEEGQASGAYNLTAPAPATNAELTRALARRLGRPALLPVPAPALRLALGEMSQQVLQSSRVLPERLLAAGFAFAHPGVGDALDAALR